MVQHAGAYQILRNLKALATGDVQITPPDELRNEINKQVRVRLQQAQDRNVQTYNTRARSVEFRAGQEFFRSNFQQSDFS